MILRVSLFVDVVRSVGNLFRLPESDAGLHRKVQPVVNPKWSMDRNIAFGNIRALSGKVWTDFRAEGVFSKR